jgi:GT2 family glycosyltransferase
MLNAAERAHLCAHEAAFHGTTSKHRMNGRRVPLSCHKQSRSTRVASHCFAGVVVLNSNPPNPPLVSVTVVCYNHSRYLQRCVNSLRAQNYTNIEIIFIDNASTDGSQMILASMPDVRLIANKINTGFSAAQNLGIGSAAGDWILCLNPDTRLEPNFISELVRAGTLDERVGTVCPKIRRMREDGTTADPPLLDSTGVYFTPLLRHHDRGSQQPDVGQFETPQYVFGYTGAAVLFRRAMIEDVSIDGEFMDVDFFFFREDADVSWRAQLLGWKCIYTPFAVGYHVRTVFENNRSSLSALINMHSTKNRFLMRIKNITPRVYWKVLVPATIRDLGIFAYVLFRERTSLSGLLWIIKNWRKTWRKRCWIQTRAKVSSPEIASWFNHHPVAKPLEAEYLASLCQMKPTFHAPQELAWRDHSPAQIDNAEVKRYSRSK